VSASDKTEYPAPATRLDRGSFRRLARCGGAPIGMLFALALAGCDGKAQSQAAAPPPPPVTVAQPVKRTVTDWDEFTGRFEAIQEAQVKARVGGFVTNVEFKDGDMVHAVYIGLIVLISNIIVAFAADLVPVRRAVPVLIADSTSRRLACVIYGWLMTGQNKSSCQ